MIAKIEMYAMAVLMAACVLLGVATWGYHGMYKSSQEALTTLKAAVKTRNDEAAAKLAELTKQVAEKDAALDASGKLLQEQKDDFQKKLDDMRFDATDAPPVRVRVVPGSCGSGGGGAASKRAPTGPVGPSTETTATGLLDPEVSRTLRGIIVDVEELQRDFNTCRADLLRRIDGHRDPN